MTYKRKLTDGQGYKHEIPTIAAMYADTPEGLCCVCERKLRYYGAGRRARVCKDAECQRVWNRVYRMDRSRREGRKPRMSPTEKWATV